jgi:membrane protease YdiL (CAAX protease family)
MTEDQPQSASGPADAPAGPLSDVRGSASDAESGSEPRTSESGFPHPDPYPFWTYGDVFLFCGLALPAMLLSWAIVKAAFAALRIRGATPAAAPLAEQFVLYLMLFGALRLIFRLQYDRPFWRSLAWTNIRFPVLWVVVAGASTAYLVAILGQLIHTPTTRNAITDLMQDRASLLLLTVFGVTLGPLCEELAFRGFLQPLLVRSLGAVPGILLAAVPFGLLHYQEYGNSWRHAVIVAAAGVAFGWMRQATGSTKASALMHASYNGLFFVATLSQRTDLLK